MSRTLSRFSHYARETSAAVALGWLALSLPSVAADSVVDAAAVNNDPQADQQAADDLDGPIVQIAPDRGELPAEAAEPTAVNQLPSLWIGLQGRTVQDPVLKTQLQLADDLGVVIESVVPDSPAEKAGLRRHDIVIGVNGKPLQDMLGLREAVVSSKGKPIELKIIRLTKEMKLSVTPEQPPKNFKMPSPTQRFGNQGFDGDVNALMRRLMQQGQFGALPQLPGMNRLPGINGQRHSTMTLPGGVSISVQSQNGQPPQATVRRGEKEWKIDSSDPNSLKQLPEDLRPTVERLLQGIHIGQLPEPQLDLDGEVQEIFPEAQRDAFDGDLNDRNPGDSPQDAEQQMLQRMQELEQKMQAMQRRFDKESKQ